METPTGSGDRALTTEIVVREQPQGRPGELAPRHVALGAAALALRASRDAVGASVVVTRTVLGPPSAAAGAVWRSAPLNGVRALAADALSGLAASGARDERRLIEQLESRGQEAVDEVLASERLERLIARAAASDRTAELLSDALAGPLTDRVVEAVVEAEVIDRVADRLLAERVPERLVSQVLASPDTEALVATTLDQPELERLIALALDSPSTDRIVAQLIDSDGMERLVGRILESDLLHETTERVVASQEMQQVVERIAKSPEVRDAVAQQSVGLANVVAREVRERGVTADSAVERIATRVLRRRRGSAAPDSGGA